MRHRALEVFGGHAVARLIGRGELGEAGGRRAKRLPHAVERALERNRQAAVARVLELLNPDGEGNVDRARGDGIGRTAQRFGAGGAHVLDPGHRNAFEPQRHGGRNGRVADIRLIQARAEPGRLDLLVFDPGIGQRFGIGFNQQVLGASIPALAELSATHADDSDLVADTRGHDQSPSGAIGTAFQK